MENSPCRKVGNISCSRKYSKMENPPCRRKVGLVQFVSGSNVKASLSPKRECSPKKFLWFKSRILDSYEVWYS